MIWLEPWEHIPDTPEWAADRQGWQRRFQKEIGPHHELSGLDTKLIGRRFDCDDALFSIPDGRVAFAHLTWSEEAGVSFSLEVDLYKSLEDWGREHMAVDHKDWVDHGN